MLSRPMAVLSRPMAVLSKPMSFDALQGQVRVWDLGFRVIEYCFAYSVPAGTVPREGRPLGQLHSCWRFIGNSLDLLPGR